MRDWFYPQRDGRAERALRHALAWFLSLDLVTRYLVRREFFETHWRTR